MASCPAHQTNMDGALVFADMPRFGKGGIDCLQESTPCKYMGIERKTPMFAKNPKWSPSCPTSPVLKKGDGHLTATVFRSVDTVGSEPVPLASREEDRSMFSADVFLVECDFPPKYGPVPSQPVNGYVFSGGALDRRNLQEPNNRPAPDYAVHLRILAQRLAFRVDASAAFAWVEFRIDLITVHRGLSPSRRGKGTGPCFRPTFFWQNVISRRKTDQSPASP
jgi:hypothetical protein